MTVYLAKTFHRVFTAVDHVRITARLLYDSKILIFVPCYFQSMFTETLLHETDETACKMFLNAP